MEALAYSIAEFCSAHRISRSGFYNAIARGEAPATMRIGRRVLISREAAEDWRRRQTAAPPATEDVRSSSTTE